MITKREWKIEGTENRKKKVQKKNALSETAPDQNAGRNQR